MPQARVVKYFTLFVHKNVTFLGLFNYLHNGSKLLRSGPINTKI